MPPHQPSSQNTVHSFQVSLASSGSSSILLSMLKFYCQIYFWDILGNHMHTHRDTQRHQLLGSPASAELVETQSSCLLATKQVKYENPETWLLNSDLCEALAHFAFVAFDYYFQNRILYSSNDACVTEITLFERAPLILTDAMINISGHHNLEVGGGNQQNRAYSLDRFPLFSRLKQTEHFLLNNPVIVEFLT